MPGIFEILINQSTELNAIWYSKCVQKSFAEILKKIGQKLIEICLEQKYRPSQHCTQLNSCERREYFFNSISLIQTYSITLMFSEKNVLEM